MKYNNTTKKWERSLTLCRGIVYIGKQYIERGFFTFSPVNIPLIYNGDIIYLDCFEHCELPLYWCNSMGCYSLDKGSANNRIIPSKSIFNYPITKCYNFSKLNLKPNKINLKLEPEFQYIKQFTFGLEYETCAGNIPWLDCLNTNLIPLYDGSITGHEYVTFPLNALDLTTIKLHLDLLEKYTRYDHNCSLHVHIGGFPINYEKIEALCKYWYYFQNILSKYIPEYSYFVEKYKDRHKSYNKPWPKIKSLIEVYENFTGNNYVDNSSFFLPNQYDECEERKWEVFGRYYNMNIMHLISGEKHKTVEFRFLRPTINYSEIKWYILIFSAFLNYVITTKENEYYKITIDKILSCTFEKDIVEKLKVEGEKLYHLHKIQITNNDFAGINDNIKNIYLTKFTNFVV